MSTLRAVNHDPRILVVGAGPAGCVAATLLARRGLDVTLVEQHRFPRDKVCGECLSALGIDVLERLGATQTLRQLHPVELNRAILHAPDGDSVALRLPRAMWGISRAALDGALLQIAADAGARVWQPARCESIDPNGAIVRDLTRNVVERIDADVVLAAEGKPDAKQAVRELGVKAHFADIAGPRDAIELFGVDGHYGGAAPIENGLWNVSFSVPVERIQHCGGDFDALFAQLATENAGLARRLNGARRIGEWLACALVRSGVSQHWPTNVIPIGNAAFAIEPIGGEGMGLAMRTAELAADAILEDRSTEALRADYARLRRSRAFACRAAAVLVLRPRLANALLGGLNGADAMVRAAMTWVGKCDDATRDEPRRAARLSV